MSVVSSVLLTATPSLANEARIPVIGPVEVPVCEEVITACDLALQAQDDLIIGLKTALKTSREQTDKALELSKKAGQGGFFESIAIPVLLGLAAGALLGAAASK